MKLKAIALASSLLVCAFAAPAFALKQGGMFEERNGAFYEQGLPQRSNLGAGGSANQVYSSSSQTAYYPKKTGVGPRPGKWCGWWMRTQLGGGAEFNVAWNWRKYGRPTSPQVGAVVVWRHHVGIITGQAANGKWIVKSGNDGGRVRERARSVKGAIFRI